MFLFLLRLCFSPHGLGIAAGVDDVEVAVPQPRRPIRRQARLLGALQAFLVSASVGGLREYRFTDFRLQQAGLSADRRADIFFGGGACHG